MSTASANQLDSRLESKSTSFSEIPIIDIAALIDGSNPMKVADEIGYVCENIGLLYIKNHGVDKQLIKDAYAQAQAFLNLPLEQKQQLNIINSGQTLRGYIPMYADNVDPENTRDFKECFDFGLNETSISPFFGPNLIPEQPASFKETFEQYHDAMMTLSRRLIRAIALSLKLPADYFEKLQKKPITIQRLLHYPPQKGKVTLEEIGIGAHTDYGFLTILSQDSVGGLQVQNRNGEWVSAPPVEDTFIVNIGDLVQTFTNDRYISTAHRVINTSGKERYSVPFFIDLDFNAEVSVVPTCHNDENPAKYEPYTCGQHKYERFVDSYAHLTS
ncbi:isopenicillin N synthase family dioxygenase [Neptunomonas sp.]|uniref:isopenicillin N synthase family dioxygenase n=1 Tax=Neptunomonas sp. TaxID=1971898 RepID=UPI0035667F19